MIPSQTQRRRSIRLPGYDYAQAGWYFVTVCTWGKASLFGEVLDESMRLNGIGRIVKECWNDLPSHFPGVISSEFIVMPNHIHGIVEIPDNRRGTACRAPTDRERFSHPVAGSLPTIVRSFKSAATKSINQLRATPGAPVWQRNYYEQVIRNEKALNRIRQYILDNPAKWDDDPENPAIQTSAR